MPVHLACQSLIFPLQDAGGDSALVWAVDKNQDGVVDLLVDHSQLELSEKHLAAVTSHLTQSGLNNLADLGLAVIIALENLRPKLALWLLTQKIRDLEEAGDCQELIEKILVSAVRRDAGAVVDCLVTNSSVNVNILDQEEPLLIRAADMKPSATGYLDIVRSLISSSTCQVNVKGSSGNTALARACDRGNTAMVAVLLSHPEVEVNLAGEDKMTPLMLAARAGHNAVVDLLLAREKIQVNLRGAVDNLGIRGKSALILASQWPL